VYTVDGSLLELDDAVCRGEDGVIGSAAGVASWMDPRSPLTDDDASSGYELAITAFGAEPFSATISSVFAASAAAGHGDLSLRDEVVDFEHGQALTGTHFSRKALSPFLFKRHGFGALDLVENLGFDLRAGQRRRPDLETGAVVKGQNGGKPDDGSLFSGHRIDLDHIALMDEVLPPAVLNDCIWFHEPPWGRWSNTRPYKIVEASKIVNPA